MMKIETQISLGVAISVIVMAVGFVIVGHFLMEVINYVEEFGLRHIFERIWDGAK